MPNPFFRLHLRQQVEADRDQLPSPKQALTVMFLDGIGGLDRVVREDLEPKGQLGELRNRVRAKFHRRADHSPNLELLFVGYWSYEMANAGLAYRNRCLCTLGER